VKGAVLYVGKAKNLFKRVSSYFQPPARLGPKTASLVARIHTIDHIPVFSETEALLLEARLIRKFKPQYNIVAKDDKSPYYIHLVKDKFPFPVINHEQKGAIAGPFLNSLVPRRILRHFRQIAPYCTSPRPVKRACFYSHLGLCHPCPGEMDDGDLAAYRQNVARLRRLLQGNFKQVKSQLLKTMQTAAARQEFEKAAQVRDKLAALEYLLSSPVMPDQFLENPNLTTDVNNEAVKALKNLISPFITVDEINRVEMYDMAHLRGDSATGAMTVAIAGQVTPRLYRHFTIKKAPSDSDVDMMKEVLTRRLNHPDWPKPDLIVVDGGKPQLSAVTHIATSHNVPVIALAKRIETVVIQSGKEYVELNPDRSHSGLKLLQRLRDEAHRFSRRLHHKQRSKKMMRN